MKSKMSHSSWAGVLVWCLGLVPASAVPVISAVEVGNVTTSEFCVCWETSELSEPGLEVFSDAGGTISLAGTVAVEMFPLRSDQRAVASSVTIREDGRTLRDEIAAKNLVLVKVSGLTPGSEYHVRPVALDGGGAVIASGSMQAVTTSQTVTFINESRQVIVDLSAIDTVGTPVVGAIIKVVAAGSPYPLLAVVGDGTAADQAYIDATMFLNAAGDSNLVPSGLTSLMITWKGLPDYTGGFNGTDLAYVGGPVVAESSVAAFELVSEDDVVFELILGKDPAVVGLPQEVRLEARAPAGEGGGLLTDYDHAAELTPTGSLLVGGGETANFVDGVLAGHTVVFATPGTVDVSIGDLFGDSETTHPVTVLPLTYENWRIYYFGDNTSPEGEPDRDPDGDGLDNAGEFASLHLPQRRDPSVLNVAWMPGGMQVWVDFNRFQSEYEVVIQTTEDLQTWNPVTVPTTLRESLPEKDIMEALLPPSQFGDSGRGFARARFVPVP